MSEPREIVQEAGSRLLARLGADRRNRRGNNAGRHLPFLLGRGVDARLATNLEKALGNVKELAETASKSQTEAYDVLVKRVRENVAEVKAIM